MFHGQQANRILRLLCPRFLRHCRFTKRMVSSISASDIVFKMNRRNFIKSSCTFCATAASAGFLASMLNGCVSLPVYKGNAEQNKINVPLSSFAESRVLIVRNSQMEFDILLVKNSENDISALFMKCTHQDNALSANKDGLYCTSHGSTFDLKGNVTKEPALKP